MDYVETNELLRQGLPVSERSIDRKSESKNDSEYNTLHDQSINQSVEISPKKTKSTVYKFKNIPPVIFGKNENNSSIVSEIRSDKETTTHLPENSEKNDGVEKQISYCPNCEVEILPNSIRRYRLGYIEFTYPVTHIWYLSSYIPLLLNLPRNLVEGIAECHESLSFGFPPLSAWSYNGLEPISWTFQNQLLEYPLHFYFSPKPIQSNKQFELKACSVGELTGKLWGLAPNKRHTYEGIFRKWTRQISISKETPPRIH